jgi:hypothetical protein
LAVGSHHIEEEEQPAALAIPVSFPLSQQLDRLHFTELLLFPKLSLQVLADLFSFDIRDYLDEAEEDTSSKALAPLSDDVKRTLEDISQRLARSLFFR